MTNTDILTCSYCNGTGVDADFGGTCSGCSGGAMTTTVPKTVEPTLDEMSALAIWLGEQTWSDFAQSLSSFYARKGYLSEKQIAAGTKMRAKCEAREANKPAAPTNPVTLPGMYALGERIFKVQAAQSSGNLYAKELVNGKFEYAAGAIKLLSADDVLSLSQAKAYGKATGTCCCCGRTLTNPASIEAGIGPICEGGF